MEVLERCECSSLECCATRNCSDVCSLSLSRHLARFGFGVCVCVCGCAYTCVCCFGRRERRQETGETSIQLPRFLFFFLSNRECDVPSSRASLPLFTPKSTPRWRKLVAVRAFEIRSSSRARRHRSPHTPASASNQERPKKTNRHRRWQPCSPRASLLPSSRAGRRAPTTPLGR